MDNLNVSLASYVKQSRICMQIGDLQGAKSNLLHACECVLLLAKTSVGKQKESYLTTFASLKKSIADIDAKLKAQIPPARNDRPSTSSSSSPTPPSYTPPTYTPPAPTNSAPTSNAQNGRSSAQTGQFTGSLSPKWLTDYIGQPQAVRAVKDRRKAWSYRQ